LYVSVAQLTGYNVTCCV